MELSPAQRARLDEGLPWVPALVRAMGTRRDSPIYDDLVSDGTFALLDLVQQYDRDDRDDASWKPYAICRLRWRLIDSMRVHHPHGRSKVKHRPTGIVPLEEVAWKRPFDTEDRNLASVEDRDLLARLWAGMSDRERQAVVADAGFGPTKQELAAQWDRDPTVVSHTLRALRRRAESKL